jgi:hypothetical protein
MNLYIAPLAENCFVLRELNDIQSLAKLPDCEALADRDLTDEILEQAARFASGCSRHSTGSAIVMVPVGPSGASSPHPDLRPRIVNSSQPAGTTSTCRPIRWRELPVVLCSAVREMFATVSRAKSPDIVTRAVRDAIESRRPRTRYGLDVLCFIARWVSDRTFDRVIFRLLGLSEQMARKRA